jgi:exodeoxyribonuclease V alpha subunit
MPRRSSTIEAMESTSTALTETVEAVVVHTIFSSEESGFAVLRCSGPHGVRFTATGTLLGARDGDRLRLTGRWVRHPRFGKQLEVTTYAQVHPSTIEGIRSTQP